MGNFIGGIIDIILVLITFALRESENRWLAAIGWGIILIAKIMS